MNNLKLSPEVLSAFLEDLNAISKKHRIIIGGCGCHGSPWLHQMDEDQVPGTYTLNFNNMDELEYTHRTEH